MEPGSSCPRCGQSLAGEPACPRCGVIFARLKARPAAASSSDPATAVPSASAGMPWGLILGFAALLAGGAIGLRLLQPARTTSPAPEATEASRQTVRPRAAASPDLPPPVLGRFEMAPPPPTISTPEAGLSEAERAQFGQLSARVNSRAPIGAADVQAAEELLARHPEDRTLRSLLSAVLMSAASRERAARRFIQAAAYLDRATVVEPDSVHPWVALLRVAFEAGDWTRTEAAARGALAVEPRNPDAWQGLGYALIRQDRNREATEALKTAVDIRPDSTTQGLLERILSGMANEKGMTEQQLSHFHVRYDGEAHAAVGREILRALERHYATLATALDYQPEAAIPVILFSREAYYTASGAPAWSAGAYHLLDGRIRIPIGGLDAGLTPDMDGTLIHELAHAFLDARTRGTVPREVNEGLAQYMEGKRIASELNPQQLRWLADGRIQGVAGLYLGGLSFVEYLVANRGMGGMNDLLKAMGETGSVDEAFKRVHGQTYHSTQQAWQQRLRQQHGS